MQLFTNCFNCKYKIYVTSNAKVRYELPTAFELNCLHCYKKYVYTPNNVYAESRLTTAGGAFLGGIIGLAFGGAGALVGTILGGLLGRSAEEQDEESVRRFNNS